MGGLCGDHQPPGNHDLADVATVGILAWPDPVLLRICEKNIEWFVGANECSEKDPAVKDGDPQHLFKEASECDDARWLLTVGGRRVHTCNEEWK